MNDQKSCVSCYNFVTYNLCFPSLDAGIIKPMYIRPEKKLIPVAVKCLLLLLLSILALVGIRLVPATIKEGWIPALALAGALGLITCAVIKVVRTR